MQKQMIEHMMTPIRRLSLGLALAALALPATAQSPFSAAIRINDSIVTNYELDQRALLLEVLRAPGDVREAALEALVNERLQLQEATRMGVLATPEEIEAGVVEFAARANLGPEQFFQAISGEGVAPETFRDFVANGISWRNVVRDRFGSLARANQRDPDEALEFAPNPENGRIRLAEIVIPVTPENQENLRSELARLAEDLNFDTATFAQAARQFSAASTRESGGLTDWRPLASIPPVLRQDMITLAPGETYGPVALGPAFAIFQMRGLTEGEFNAPSISSIEYATIPLPGGTGEEALAARAALRADIDVCDDLYGERPGAFEITEAPLGEIPRDIAMAISLLDDGEISYDVVRNNGTVTLAVMLCNRVAEVPEAGLEAVQLQLYNQDLESYANGLLEELRADAIIDYAP